MIPMLLTLLVFAVELAVYALIIFASIFLVKYAVIIIKRSLLVKKLKKKCPGGVKLYRNKLYSVFVRDGKPDICLNLHGKEIDVSLITTPYRRARYHFCDNRSLEIVVKRNFVFAGIRGNVADLGYTSILRRYRINFDKSENDTLQRYAILYPAPKVASKAENASYTILYDNDVIFENVRVCGLKYFIDNVM